MVAELEAELLAEYRNPALVTKPEKLSYRGGAFYSEAAVRLIASLHAGTGDVQVVDVRNDGALPGLPDDAVVEIPCTVDRNGAHPIPQRPLAPEMAGLVAHCKAYERLAVEAARVREPGDGDPGPGGQPARRAVPEGRTARRHAPVGQSPVPPSFLPGSAPRPAPSSG